MDINNSQVTLHPNSVKVQEALSRSGCAAQVVTLPDSTRSAKDAAQSLGTSVAQIAKSLVFLADGQPIIVIASGINRVCQEKLAALASAAISQPDGKLVKDLVGFPIGGVPPVGYDGPMRVFIDQDLLQYDKIWAAAGTPNSVFACTPQELVSATGGMVCELREGA